MKYDIFKTLLFIAVLFFFTSTRSQNIIGGEFTYALNASGLLESKVTVYTVGDTVINVSVEYGDGGINNYFLDGEDIGGGIYKYYVADLHVLPTYGSYLVICESGNMRSDIINITDSDTKLFTMEMIVHYDETLNTAPIFLEPIASFSTADICTILHNESAYDVEGDSIVYSMNAFKVKYGIASDGYIPWASDTIFLDSLSGTFHWESPPAAGLYALCFQTSEYRDGILFGTSERKYVVEVDCFVSSIFNSAVSNQFPLYPNPVFDILHIPFSDNVKEIYIYNSIGAQILSIGESEVGTTMHLENLPPDLYFIVFTNQKNNILTISKFVKTK